VAQLLLKCYLVMLILTAVSTMCFYGYAVRTHLYYDGLGWCKSSRDKTNVVKRAGVKIPAIKLTRRLNGRMGMQAYTASRIDSVVEENWQDPVFQAQKANTVRKKRTFCAICT
jgi:hypothetical protein